MFNIAWKDEAPDLEVQYLTRPVASLARTILSFNTKHTAAGECDSASVEDIKAILKRTMNIDRADKMNGIKDV